MKVAQHKVLGLEFGHFGRPKSFPGRARFFVSVRGSLNHGWDSTYSVGACLGLGNGQTPGPSSFVPLTTADRSGRAKSRDRLVRDGHPADVPTANDTYAPFS
jgi:hypothetical protein